MLPEGASQYVRGTYQIQKVKKQLQKANARTNESVPDIRYNRNQDYKTIKCEHQTFNVDDVVSIGRG